MSKILAVLLLVTGSLFASWAHALEPIHNDQITDDDSDGYNEVRGDCDDQNAGVHPEAMELCDGIDNDCNGEVDDNARHVGVECQVSPGHPGVMTCSNGALVCMPPQEICDNDLDDNGDGAIDENCAPEVDQALPDNNGGENPNSSGNSGGCSLNQKGFVSHGTFFLVVGFLGIFSLGYRSSRC